MSRQVSFLYVAQSLHSFFFFQSVLASVPRFYFPSPAVQGDEALRAEFNQRIESSFSAHPGGMPQKAFVDMVNEVGP